MKQIVIGSFSEFEHYIGKEIGVSEYLPVSQEQITQFAQATLDFQWIHTDPQRASKESPFGTTIAHGYLTVSLLPHLWEQIVEFQNVKLMVNYGIEKLKFNQAVKVNDRVRLRVSLENLQNLRGVIKAQMKVRLEIEGNSKPAFDAVVVFLYHFN
jgi:acyl dehydratase